MIFFWIGDQAMSYIINFILISGLFITTENSISMLIYVFAIKKNPWKYFRFFTEIFLKLILVYISTDYLLLYVFFCLMVSSAYWHINLRRLFNAKAILREQQWCYLTHSWEDKEVHTFPKGICLKVRVIARLEFELAYYDSAAYRFNHYTTSAPPNRLSMPQLMWVGICSWRIFHNKMK